MDRGDDEEALSKEILREFIADRNPEYLPYIELIWSTKDRPVSGKKTRGMEELLLGGFIVPFLAHFSAMLVYKYYREKTGAKKIRKHGKKKAQSKKVVAPPENTGDVMAMRGIPEEGIDSVLKEARKEFPGLSDDDYNSLAKSTKKVLKVGR